MRPQATRERTPFAQRHPIADAVLAGVLLIVTASTVAAIIWEYAHG